MATAENKNKNKNKKRYDPDRLAHAMIGAFYSGVADQRQPNSYEYHIRER